MVSVKAAMTASRCSGSGMRVATTTTDTGGAPSVGFSRIRSDSVGEDRPQGGHRREHQRQLALAAGQAGGHPAVGGRQAGLLAHGLLFGTWAYLIVQPASTVNSSPVTYRASSEARNSTALLMSRGSTESTGSVFW